MSTPQPGGPLSRPDPLIDDVRAIRKAICDQFGNDVDRLCDHLKEIEQQHRGRLVRRKDLHASRGVRKEG